MKRSWFVSAEAADAFAFLELQAQTLPWRESAAQRENRPFHEGGNQPLGLIEGTDGKDTLIGTGGDDLIDGKKGADRLSGGAGNDTYIVDHRNDRVIENEGAGVDVVRASVNYTLGSNIENLILTGSAKEGYGNSSANELTGNSLANVLDGREGADTMSGAGGNDTYFVDHVGDVIVELVGGGIDTVYSVINYSLGDQTENLVLAGLANISAWGNRKANTITGNSADNFLFGDVGADALNGAAGQDSLDGGSGADTLAGGLGDDQYVVDDTGDVIVELDGQGTDSVQSSVSWTLGISVENLSLVAGAVSGTGNALDNQIIGNDANNVLDGGAGADTLVGGLGDDQYLVDDAGDLLLESDGEGTDSVQSSVSWTLGSALENLSLVAGAVSGTGNALDNLISGNDADNVLDGGAGADSLMGGLGDDQYLVDDAGDVIVELDGEGVDSVQSSVDWTLGAALENLSLVAGAVSGTGNVLGNQISGNNADNVLDGGAGADTLAGGLGDDQYVVEDAGDVIVELDGEGVDSVQSSISWTLAAALENLSLVGGALSGTGNALDNQINGNDANNLLDGGSGVDTLAGSLGDDLYLVDDAGDVLLEAEGEGTDSVQSSVSWTLGEALENLSLLGGAISGTGNELDNQIIGNDANNVLDGGSGADNLIGSLGDDQYFVDDVGDVLIEADGEGADSVQSSISWTLGAALENLSLVAAAVSGSGNELGNQISGNNADNVLDGGAGADTLAGGLGDDQYLVEDAGDVIVELGGEGTDSVLSSISWTLGAALENLSLLGGAISGTGNELDNQIIGNDANNVLDGGAGADTLAGRLGDDLYAVDDAGDAIVESDGEGVDSVQSSISWTLGTALENLSLVAGALSGTGNALDNQINGNDANNVLDGGSGADTLIGSLGDDQYLVDDAGDVDRRGWTERVLTACSPA